MSSQWSSDSQISNKSNTHLDQTQKAAEAAGVHVGIMDFELQFLINALGMILSTIPASDSLALKSHELLQYPLNPRQIAIPKGPGNANIRASKRKK